MPNEFNEYDSDTAEEGSGAGLLSFLSGRKVQGIGAIVLAVIVVLIVVLFVGTVLRPDLFQGKSRFSLSSDAFDNLSFKGSLSVNGKLVDTFANDGNTLKERVNLHETRTITLHMHGLSDGNKIATAVIRLSDGTRITLNSDAVSISPDGTVTLLLNPEDDLGLTDEEIAALADGSLSFDLEFTIENTAPDETIETVVLDVPVELLFSEFAGLGCIEINRDTVSESTHNGVLETDIKIKVTCDTAAPLTGVLQWKSARMGNVEILLDTSFNGSTLTTNTLPLKQTLTQGTYSGKIIFTPLADFAGQVAQFNVVLASSNATATVGFDVALDNLEQCVTLSSPDAVISNETDTASLTVDASKCSSQKIDFLLCDGDPTCSFADEGGITLSTNAFSLTGTQNTKTITIERGDIPGVYGVTVKARIAGLGKTLIGEQVITVQPTAETLVPDRFEVSLLGKGSKDSVRVTNKTLAETTAIDASICSVYKSSLGLEGQTITGGSGASPLAGGAFQNSWWKKLLTEEGYFSGIGKYQASFSATLGDIDNTRMTVQQIAAQKNALIKKAYLDVKAIQNNLQTAVDASTASSAAMEKLNTAAEKYNQYKNLNITSQYGSLTSSTVQIANSSVLCTELTSQSSLSTAAQTAAETCTASSSAPPNIAAPLETGKVVLAEGITCGELALSTTNLVNTVDAMTSSPIPDIDPQQAADFAASGLNTTTAVQQNMQVLFEDNDAMLAAAAPDSFATVSQGYVDAKQYLLEMKQANTTNKQLLTQARDFYLHADDAITTLITEAASDLDLILAGTTLLVQATELTAKAITSQGISEGALTAASAANADSLTHILSFDSTACASKITGAAACAAVCDGAAAQASVDSGAGLKAITTHSGSVTAALAGWAGVFDLMNTSFQLASGMLTDFAAELVDAKVANQKVLDALNAAVLASENAEVSIDAAIEAADYLAVTSQSASSAASYTTDLTTSSEEFDKKEMTGLVASAVANGFVNGAYEGGVYTTAGTNPFNTTQDPNAPNTANITPASAHSSSKVSLASDTTTSPNTELLEDCANRVQLQLIDYTTNLLTDAKDVAVSNGNVLSYWSFSDPKVFGFFQSQQVGLVFANSGLTKNGYGIVTLTMAKHTHAPLTTITGSDFGPLDIPDASAQDVSYKYHFKFNAAPRRAPTPPVSSVCSNGLLLGSTGAPALPKIILGWDWNSVSSDTIKNNYLDSTQLSILVSKNISAFDNIISQASLSCPKNEAFTVLAAIAPVEATPAPLSCHLPLTTRLYEGKPALYYFLNSVSIPPEGYDAFFSGDYASDAERVLSLIDFNVNLMHDGLGTNFQSDFKYDYSSSILKASPAFTDSSTGLANYFGDTSRFYFSSEYLGMKSASTFVLPDAGTYNVQLLIDYDDSANPAISLGGSRNAHIIVSPVLVTPLDKESSPFYYTPFDGSVGLSASNDRIGYGTSLSKGSSFSVSKEDGATLEPQQKDSLAKIASTTIENFNTLNSLPSRRGKVLEYQYLFNGTSDANSTLVFSPTIATPLIMNISGQAGQTPVFTYAPTKQLTPQKPTTNNLLLVSGLSGCKDFFGNDSTTLFNQTPDLTIGTYYGVGFQSAQVSGAVPLKTVVYVPTSQDYSLTFNPGGQLFTTNNQTPATNIVPLDGISGSAYNDPANESTIETLTDMFNAVTQKNMCVSNFGDKEVYWWPEDYLYEKENADGRSLHDKELALRASCIK